MGRQNWIWKCRKVKMLAVHDYKIPTGRIAVVRINTWFCSQTQGAKGINPSVDIDDDCWVSGNTG